MISEIRRATTEPASFFRDASIDSGLKKPAVVVAAVAVAGLLGSIPTFMAVTEAAPEGAGVFVLLSFAFGSVIGAMGPFVSWLIVTVLLFVGSLAFSGEGTFRELFGLVGWGFAPRLLVPIVGGVTSFVLLSGTDFSDPQQARQLAQTTATGTIGLVNQVVNAATFLWAGWVWTYALAEARELSTRTAGILVGVVVVLQIVVNVGLSLLSASLV